MTMPIMREYSNITSDQHANDPDPRKPNHVPSWSWLNAVTTSRCGAPMRFPGSNEFFAPGMALGRGSVRATWIHDTYRTHQTYRTYAPLAPHVPLPTSEEGRNFRGFL